MVAGGLRWAGLRWDLPQLWLRLGWIGAALALVLLAALFFDRFDPARGRRSSRAARRAGEQPAAPVVDEVGTLAAAALPREGTGPNIAAAESAGPPAPIHLTPLSVERGWGFPGMLAAELRLALKGYSWWWYAVAAGLLVAQCAAPLEVSRGPLLTAAWIWPILLWSGMGAREARYGTEQLIFSSSGIMARQFPASWLVGVLIAVATGGGTAVRLLLAADYAGLFGWFAGALFVPTLALALGAWTKSSRPFEALFTGLWYVGPLNHVPGLDFTGGASGPHTVEYGGAYLALTCGLLAVAFWGRGRQLRHA